MRAWASMRGRGRSAATAHPVEPFAAASDAAGEVAAARAGSTAAGDDALSESECNGYGFYPPKSVWAPEDPEADTTLKALRSAGL